MYDPVKDSGVTSNTSFFSFFSFFFLSFSFSLQKQLAYML